MNTAQAYDRIEEILFQKMQAKLEGRAFLLQNLRASFLANVDESLDCYPNELKAIFERLETAEYIELRKLPGGLVQIKKGINYSQWVLKRNSNSR